MVAPKAEKTTRKPLGTRMDTEFNGGAEDKEYLVALARMRKHQSNITAETVKKFKAMDLPEISGNLSRKRFFFF